MDDKKVPENIRKMLEDFILELKGVYGEGLISVVLYGSASSGEFSSKHSNVNVAVILDDARLTNLARMSALINKSRFRMVYPVFFTEDYLNRSTDVFPIEFLDMQENHITLYGKEVLKHLKIDPKNLRFQCEQELKSKLINIKRSYLKTNTRQELISILFKSFTSTLHILRNLIRIKGAIPSYSKEGVLNEISREFGVDVRGFSKILRAKNGNMKLSHKEADGLFIDFVDSLEHIVNIVDGL